MGTLQTQESFIGDLICYFVFLAVVTISIKTILCDELFVGFALCGVGFALCGVAFASGVAALSTGSFPLMAELDCGQLSRWFYGFLWSLRIEISAEVTPPGFWKIAQLRRDPRDVENIDVHSAHDDPRVHALLVEWLRNFVWL